MAKKSPDKLGIKIKRMSEKAVIPMYQTTGSAGFDLVAAEDVLVYPQSKVRVKTGLAFEIPAGNELQIRPRSGVSANTDLVVTNSPATIDSDYRGELLVLIKNESLLTTHTANVLQKIDGTLEYIPDEAKAVVPVGTYVIKAGDRIAQAVIAPVMRAEFTVTDELQQTERGDGGFGSTGTTTGETEVPE